MSISLLEGRERESELWLDMQRRERDRGGKEEKLCSLEFFMDSALHFVSLQTKVHIPATTMVDVILERRNIKELVLHMQCH